LRFAKAPRLAALARASRATLFLRPRTHTRMTKPYFASQSARESSRGQAGIAASIVRPQGERLLLDAQSARGLVHRLALIDAEAQHRLAQHRSHFNPDQPRVPTGNPDGGQWTSTGATRIGPQLAGGGKPPLGPHILLTILEVARRLIEDYRSKNGPWDLFGYKTGAVTVVKVDGKDIFGSNSTSPTYTTADRAAAVRLRTVLVEKHPKVFAYNNVGQRPNDALFHAETTVLLRAARENGGTLAGRTLTVFGDTDTCLSCRQVLPYVGVELGNPTVTFVHPDGSTRTMRDGSWDR
jgi:hypothetical protein